MGALITLGCTRSGDVVVMIDSTMPADSVEVVALAAERHRVSSDDRTAAPPGDSVARLRALDDSAASLEMRFRDLRAALTSDVADIDTMDRRSQEYATRYDAIVRRTRDAEQVRTDRDSTRARAERLRARLGPRAEPAGGTPATRVASADTRDEPRSERRRVRGRSVTLSLAPGNWWIGVARAGGTPLRYDSVTVRQGTTDTLDLRGIRPRPVPDRR